MMHKYDPRISPKKVAIAGARGYSGLELVRILLKHPNVEISACFANESEFQLPDYLPEIGANGVPVLPMQRFEEVVGTVDTLFLATPAEVSAKLAPIALKAGANVVDLSGAFRLSPDAAQEQYGLTAEQLGTLAEAEYGLVPWAGPSLKKPGAKLISNPGCYATAVLMGLLPLLKKGLIDPATLVIDAKSGATGAGRKAAENLLFCEVEGECLPYKIGKHQHLPEIREHVRKFTGAEIDPMFVTHLLPVRRGILAGIYARTPEGVTLDQISDAFADSYRGYDLLRHGKLDETKRQLLTLKRISGSARCEVRYTLKNNQLYVFSIIDNLMKGAASQAVENFNRLHDFPLTAVLNQFEGNL